MIVWQNMGDHHDENRVLAILKIAVENTNEAFVTIDENQKVVFFNKAAEKIFGYSRNEVIGHDLNVIMSASWSRDHHAAVDRFIKTGIPKRIGQHTEIVATRKNGDLFPADISFSVSEEGSKLYFTGIIRDLTETKALQDKIEKSKRLAALGQVVAEISHEIKNPLMLIGGFVRQVIRTTKDEQSLTKLNTIVEEVSRLESLLKELSELYLPRTLRKKEIDIHNLLEEVYLLVKDDCEKNNIQAKFQAPGEPILVEGDRSRLKQVFLNLIKNSIEAMEEGGNLLVQCKSTENNVEIIFEDNGCGIPKTSQEEIFSPFFTTKKLGTGLGLSISKGIIEDHEGSSLTLMSKEGEGTTFKVTMPVYRPALKYQNI